MSISFDYLYKKGRVGLTRILLGLGVSSGDKVAIQAYTCVAVPEALKAIGALPIYIDIEADSVNMCHKELEISLTKNSIKAIIIQHTFGIPASMDKISFIANKHRIPIIEDCCHTVSSSFKGIKVGNWSVASFFSFEWGKPIIAGIGGAINVKDESLSNFIKKDYLNLKTPGLMQNIKNLIQLIVFKIFYRPKFYWFLKDAFHKFSKIGIATANFYSQKEYTVDNASSDFKEKMPFINRIQLYSALKTMDKDMEHRKKIGELYQSKFTGEELLIKTINLPDENIEIYFSRFPLLVENKKQILQLCRNNSIELASFFDTPIHPLKDEELSRVNYNLGSCPNAESVCERLVSLPVNSKVSFNDVIRISDYIKSLSR